MTAAARRAIADADRLVAHAVGLADYYASAIRRADRARDAAEVERLHAQVRAALARRGSVAA